MGKQRVGGSNVLLFPSKYILLWKHLICGFKGSMERRAMNLNSKELNLVLTLPFFQLDSPSNHLGQYTNFSTPNSLLVKHSSCLNWWFSRCGTQSTSITLTWEPGSNAHSWAPPQTYGIRNSEHSSVFSQALQVILMDPIVGEQLAKVITKLPSDSHMPRFYLWMSGFESLDFKLRWFYYI